MTLYLKHFFQEKEFSRLFIFENGNSIHSFYYPFRIRNTDEIFELTTMERVYSKSVTADVISFFLSIFNESDIKDLSKNLLYEIFLDNMKSFCFDELSEQEQKELWNFLVYLIYYDTGYIRYDYDADNVNGDIHPLMHIDINYEEGASLKFGLGQQLNLQDFVSMISKKTRCFYLSHVPPT